MQFLQKILFSEQSKEFIKLLVFVITFTFGGEVANATEPLLSEEDSSQIVSILNGFITVAAALMGMVTGFITMFLYPGWVNGTLFGLQDYLKELWILVSNVVYFAFAFILIAIAFMNIIGRSEGTWELKQAMPKFIVGVLIVPFSWFFVQFVLSISAILTVGVLTLPYNSFQNHDLYVQAIERFDVEDEKICTGVVISLNGEFDGIDIDTSGGEGELDEFIKCRKDSKVTIKEILTGVDEEDGSSTGLQNSIFGIISVYSYGILRIQDLDTITGTDLQSITKIADLILKIIFDLLFIVVYLLLMIALGLALFTRGVRLWLYMMLSPLFGLMYFFGKGSDGFGDTGKMFNIKEFIAVAMVPVYVSAALAFGLVFILVASEGIQSEGDNVNELKAGGFSLTLTGAHGSGESEKSVIGKLIVEIFGVVILWIAVMAALSASETTKAVVEPIQKFGDSVGSMAAKAPTYAPVIPTPGGAISTTGLAAGGQQIASAIDSQFRKQGTDRASSFLGEGGNTPAAGLRGANAPYESTTVEGNGSSIEATLGNLKSHTNDERIKDRDFRKQFAKDLGNVIRDDSGKALLTPEQIRQIESASNPEQFSIAVTRAIKENASELGSTQRTKMTEFLGEDPSSIERLKIEQVLGINGATGGNSQGSNPQGPQATTNNVNVNINGNSTTFTNGTDTANINRGDIIDGTTGDVDTSKLGSLGDVFSGNSRTEVLTKLKQGGFDDTQAEAIADSLGITT